MSLSSSADATRAAAFTSAAMIAHQVAGKAVRDALFLTSFPATALPWMMAFAATMSLLAAVGLSRGMSRFAPARILPILFGGSACAFVVEWALGFASPAAMAIVFYVHLALVGPVMISAFWSLINEHYDPYNAKRAVARIAAGGTIGGVVGGLMAWSAAATIPIHTLVLILASLHVACLIGTMLIHGQRTGVVAPSESIPTESSTSKPPGLRVLYREPLLRNLALLVAIGAAMSSLLDYTFSSHALTTIGKGGPLLAFFALFWLAVAVVSLVVQVTLGRRVLEKHGLAKNVAVLPSIIIMGGVVGLVVPGLFSTALLRGAEAVHRNTLYRSAYELFYTPLSERQKRSMKALIDIGCDRLGTVFGAGVIMVWLAVSPHVVSRYYLLAIVVLLAASTLPIVRKLQSGYVAALEHGLRDKAIARAPRTRTNREPIIAEGPAAEPTTGLPQIIDLGLPSEGSGPAYEALVVPHLMTDGRALLTGPVATAAITLKALSLDSSPVTGYVILLLAHKELHREAFAALSRSAPAITGQMIDALIHPTMDLVVRRRIPLALACARSQRAVDGLLLGLSDDSFDVRYACGRALIKMSEAPGISISRPKILQAILIELDNKDRGIALAPIEADPFVESLLFDDESQLESKDRILEHVFTILGLHLEREPLRMAYRALYHDDLRHRGTALEYLQTVLPEDIRDAVWPFVADLASLPPARSAREILADLLRETVVASKATPQRH